MKRWSKQVVAASFFLLIFGALPVVFDLNYLQLNNPISPFFGKMLLIILLISVYTFPFILDQKKTTTQRLVYGALIGLSIILAYIHISLVDVNHQAWQLKQFVDIINQRGEIPHQYRFVPVGIIWWFVALSGKYLFASFIFRLIFQYAFLVAFYKLCQKYCSPLLSGVAILIYATLYPLSILYYKGQIIDPLFHFLFAAALIFCIKKDLVALFAIIILGVFVKESIILVVPLYFLLNRKSKGSLAGATGLVLAGVVVAVLIRMNFGYDLSMARINGVPQLMIFSNLGIPGSKVEKVVNNLEIFIRYFHPALFIFLWQGIIIYFRKKIPQGVFYAALFLSISIFVTNSFFGWNYESRNFVPALIFLLPVAISALDQSSD
ncbi:hypothetical protein ACFL52_01440 [Candidatus Margulisiibacteriota bacterium]